MNTVIRRDRALPGGDDGFFCLISGRARPQNENRSGGTAMYSVVRRDRALPECTNGTLKGEHRPYGQR